MPGLQDRVRPVDDDAGNLHLRRHDRDARDRHGDDAQLGSSIRRCRSAAVWWLRTAPGPARSRAAQSTVSRAGSPEKAAYTPVAAAAIGRCVPGPHRLGVDAHVWTLTPRDGGRLSLEALREHFG